MWIMNKNLRKGFTLIELLIVMVILGLLASLVGPALIGRIDTSQIQTAKTQMQLLSTALDTYRLDVGSYPDNLNELRGSEKRNWSGPYLPKDVPMDPWGNPYVYSKPGDNGMPYKLMTYAKDGKPGGEGDNTDLVL